MKQHLIELYRSCRTREALASQDQFNSANVLIGSEIERFAELIVQECLKKIEEEYKPVLEDTEMMKDTHWDGYVQCGVDSYVSVREHFLGVEE